MIKRNRLIKTTKTLININSENPPADCREISNFLSAYFKKAGLKCKFYEVKKGLRNVLVFVPGAGRHTLLLSPHLDTVPAATGWKNNPFSGKVKNNRIYGRGATDCKGNAAVLMEVIKSLVEDKVVLGYNLLLFFAADEETGSHYSLIPLLKSRKHRIDKALILDAGEFDIVVVQKGLLHCTIQIFGKKAHAAYNWRGENAIEIACNIIKDLKAIKLKYKKHKLLKSYTVNIGKIQGGDKVNVVADYCEFELDLRFLPGMKPKEIIVGIRKLISRHAKKFKLNIDNLQMPYEISPKNPMVKQLLKSAGKFKATPKIKGSEGATVITFFDSYGIDAIATGWGAHGCAHVADEYVKIPTLYKGAKVLEDFLKEYNYEHS